MDTSSGDRRPIEFINLRDQYRRLKPTIDSRIQRVLEHGQFIMGPEIEELEESLARFVGVSHCIGVADGTTALLVAMMALGIGSGDEVVTTPFTFIATGEMISLLGARPIFVDIDPRTCNLDPSGIEAAITPRTRAILPVSLYGQCADMDAINSLAARHGLPVIEDAAQSFGATQNGRRSAGLSTIACTSFFPSKPLGCYGDGGACFTNDPALAEKIARIRVHGQEKRYVHTMIGVNGRLDTLQAAILLAKLETFPQEVEQRAHDGARYDRLIREAGISEAKPVEIVEGNTSVYAQYTIRIPRRDAVAAYMKQLGIPTAVHYPVCLHRQPVYAKAGYDGLAVPHAEQAAAEVLSLPMYPGIEEGLQRRIVAGLSEALQATSESAVSA